MNAVSTTHTPDAFTVEEITPGRYAIKFDRPLSPEEFLAVAQGLEAESPFRIVQP